MKKYRGRKSRDTAPLNFRNKKPYISSTTVQYNAQKLADQQVARLEK